MFIHDNGKVCVLSLPRSGHTNMFHYFGIEQYTGMDFQQWVNSNSRVMVVRHPAERFLSAVGALAHYQTFPSEDDRRCYYQNFYKFYQFRIIDFNRLPEYIPRFEGKYQSVVTNTKFDENSISMAVECYTKNGMEHELPEFYREIEAYHKIMETREEISPSEWKEKTLDNVHS